MSIRSVLFDLRQLGEVSRVLAAGTGSKRMSDLNLVGVKRYVLYLRPLGGCDLSSFARPVDHNFLIIQGYMCLFSRFCVS